VTEQFLTVARENPSSGYTRLRGALHDLRFDVARSTIQALLKQNGIEPAPRRGKRCRGRRSSLRNWGTIAAADFFHVEVLTVGGLVRYAVSFVIDLKTRSVQIAGISSNPDGAWMAQVARTLTDVAEGSLKGTRYLDRQPGPALDRPLQVDPRVRGRGVVAIADAKPEPQRVRRTFRRLDPAP
jgi:hypothetical protein